jgi:hypothetical protein
MLPGDAVLPFTEIILSGELIEKIKFFSYLRTPKKSAQ